MGPNINTEQVVKWMNINIKEPIKMSPEEILARYLEDTIPNALKRPSRFRTHLDINNDNVKSAGI